MLISQEYETYQANRVEELGKATSLRSLEEGTANFLQLEQETEGLLKQWVSFGEVQKSLAL